MKVLILVLIVLTAGCQYMPESYPTSGYQTRVIEKIGDKCPQGYGNGRGAYCYSINI